MVLWLNEAHFTLSGQFNTRICIIWETDNPRCFIKVSLHSAKVTVWIGMTSKFVLQLSFFEDDLNREEHVMMNSEQYLEMLQLLVVPSYKSMMLKI